MTKIFIPVLVAFAFSVASCSKSDNNNQLAVIPYPSQVLVHGDKVTLPNVININLPDSAYLEEAQLLNEKLISRGYNASVSLSDENSKGVNFSYDSNIEGIGAYKLSIDNDNIDIAASTPEGIFYAMQTLLQLVDNNNLVSAEISDAPRYQWRGFMLDEARHFSGADRVKELLDLMAYYKMNKFHWHLTDAQGWRIEIKKYPNLSAVGGIGTHSDPETPAQFYTQDQIKDIIEYARRRHIEIIPEIDMPGHATASNRAYPEFNGGGSEMFPDFTFNPGYEGTYQYLGDILTEVAEIFPSNYIHIGGDEVAYGSEAWESDKHVQALLKREGLKNVKEAEQYFMHRMINKVSSLDKTLIGWDELLDLGVDKSTAIMWWRHDKPHYLLKSLDSDYNTVMCPRKPLYFDFVQADSHNVGRKWDGFCPIDYVYAFPDTLFNSLGVTDKQQQHILGIQANAWSELLHTKQRVDFMTFPRICALAESAWSMPESKDFAQFQQRLNDAYRLFDKMNIYYYDYRDSLNHLEPIGPEIKKPMRKSETNYKD